MSEKQSDAAEVLIKTSPGPGFGIGISSTVRLPGPWKTHACIVVMNYLDGKINYGLLVNDSITE
jgi:hypothetical protein